MKGDFNEGCYRSSCGNSSAQYWHFSNRKHYCEECARELNEANRVDAMKLYGHDLLILDKNNEFAYQDPMSQGKPRSLSCTIDSTDPSERFLYMRLNDALISVLSSASQGKLKEAFLSDGEFSEKVWKTFTVATAKETAYGLMRVRLMGDKSSLMQRWISASPNPQIEEVELLQAKAAFHAVLRERFPEELGYLVSTPLLMQGVPKHE